MSRAADNFAYQYGDDIEADTKPAPRLDAPLCEADAEARRLSIAADNAERAARIDREVVNDRAEQRARCTIKWDRELRDLVASINRVRALRRHHGFHDPLLDEGRELIHRVFREVCEPDHKGGNEG